MGWETWYEKTTFDTAVLSICRSSWVQEGNSMLPWQKLKKNMTLQKSRKNSMKMTDFSPRSIYMNNFKIPKYGSTQKNQPVMNPRTEKYIYRPNDELWRIWFFIYLFIFLNYFSALCGYKIDTPICFWYFPLWGPYRVLHFLVGPYGPSAGCN